MTNEYKSARLLIHGDFDKLALINLDLFLFDHFLYLILDRLSLRINSCGFLRAFLFLLTCLCFSGLVFGEAKITILLQKILTDNLLFLEDGFIIIILSLGSTAVARSVRAFVGFESKALHLGETGGLGEAPGDYVNRIVRVLRVVLVHEHHLFLIWLSTIDREESGILALGGGRLLLSLDLGIKFLLGGSLWLFGFLTHGLTKVIAKTGVIIGVADHTFGNEGFAGRSSHRERVCASRHCWLG